MIKIIMVKRGIRQTKGLLEPAVSAGTPRGMSMADGNSFSDVKPGTRKKRQAGCGRYYTQKKAARHFYLFMFFWKETSRFSLFTDTSMGPLTEAEDVMQTSAIRVASSPASSPPLHM